MGIEQLITWYQKKIGTYDKQLWEKTIEQRILRSLANIKFKNAVRKRSMCNTDCCDNLSDMRPKDVRHKTEFIDIDLVRGSSFTKTKPKHGLVTVAKLATLRYFLLPLYSKWWMEQTSGKIFLILFLIYLGQFLNVAIYSYNISKLTEDSSERVPSSEIVVPIVMGWILSLIHSQIVSTQSDRNSSLCQTQRRRNFRRRRKGKTSPVTKTSNISISVNECSDLIRNTNSQKNVFPKCVIFKPPNDGIPEAAVASDNMPPPSDNLLRRREVNTLQPSVDDGFESFNGNCSSPDTNEEYEAAMSTACSLSNLNVSPINGEESDDVSRETNFSNEDAGKIKVDESKMHHLKPAVSLYSRKLKSNSGKLKIDVGLTNNESARQLNRRPWKSHSNVAEESTSCDSEDGETMSSPDIGESFIPTLTEGTTSATEWMGVTTNTEDCSYSSELEPSDNENVLWDTPFNPSAILNPYAVSDRVSCTVWKRNEIKKVEMSVFDISCEIIARVEEVPETIDYFYVCIFYTVILALLPALCRLSNAAIDSAASSETQLSVVEISELVLEKLSGSMISFLDAAFGQTLWERIVTIGSLVQRLVFACFYIFLLSVAERTFKQRFLYAKLFSHLTSSRRARKSQLPHFRLNKVRNIKSWLSVRSFLKKRGPQRSIDVIVSSAFVITLLLLSFLSMELLKDCGALNSQYNLEALFWCLGLGCVLLRFMTLGTKINQKYRSNLSILITEQINLYLQIEQKPHKKEELNVANSVLKLAADLLKELETPFKISGLSTNPHIYTITKVFVLSALSGVLSEMLGFKLKLHKIKIK